MAYFLHCFHFCTWMFWFWGHTNELPCLSASSDSTFLFIESFSLFSHAIWSLSDTIVTAVYESFNSWWPFHYTQELSVSFVFDSYYDFHVFCMCFPYLDLPRLPPSSASCGCTKTSSTMLCKRLWMWLQNQMPLGTLYMQAICNSMAQCVCFGTYINENVQE